MKLFIAGSTELKPSYGFLRSAIQMFGICEITEIIILGIEGVDAESHHLASHMQVEVTQVDKVKSAVDYADEVLLIHNEDEHSINIKLDAMRQDKPVYEIEMRRS